jgi:hypothetical protein
MHINVNEIYTQKEIKLMDDLDKKMLPMIHNITGRETPFDLKKIRRLEREIQKNQNC